MRHRHDICFVSKPPDTITRIIMGALVIWGALLALGAWRLDGDYRKPWIVLGCTFGFLALWWFVLNRFAVRRHREALEGEATWSTSALISFGLVPIIALGLLWDFWLGSWTELAARALRFGMLALIMVATIAATVSLSDPRKLRGKMLGLVALVFCLLAAMAAMVYPL